MDEQQRLMRERRLNEVLARMGWMNWQEDPTVQSALQMARLHGQAAADSILELEDASSFRYFDRQRELAIHHARKAGHYARMILAFQGERATSIILDETKE